LVYLTRSPNQQERNVAFSVSKSEWLVMSEVAGNYNLLDATHEKETMMLMEKVRSVRLKLHYF
jgi:hypothetical protein